MPKPQKILVDTENKLVQINWQDDHESVYNLTYLRRACPCAECQPWKEGVGKPGESPEAVLKAVGDLKAVSDVSAVGGYAIQFNWADGHSYGIYNWDYLRDLCPCDEDTAKRRQSPVL
ncbi:MAG TPA: DUF971 domain-containing protein [Anaerolineae bacterium]